MPNMHAGTEDLTMCSLGKTTHQPAIISYSCDQLCTLLHWDTEARENRRKGWVTATASIIISFHGGGKKQVLLCALLPVIATVIPSSVLRLPHRAVGDKSRLRELSNLLRTQGQGKIKI